MNISQQKDFIANHTLSEYHQFLAKSVEKFEEAKKNKIAQLKSDKISCITVFSRWFRHYFRSKFSAGFTLFVFFMIQFFILYYPFVQITQLIIDRDFSGVSGYVLLLIAELIAIGLVSKHVRIVDHKKIKEIEEYRFIKSPYCLSLEQFKKEYVIDEKMKNYIINRMPHSLIKSLINSDQIDYNKLEKLTYLEVLEFVEMYD